MMVGSFPSSSAPSRISFCLHTSSNSPFSSCTSCLLVLEPGHSFHAFLCDHFHAGCQPYGVLLGSSSKSAHSCEHSQSDLSCSYVHLPHSCSWPPSDRACFATPCPSCFSCAPSQPACGIVHSHSSWFSVQHHSLPCSQPCCSSSCFQIPFCTWSDSKHQLSYHHQNLYCSTFQCLHK